MHAAVAVTLRAVRRGEMSLRLGQSFAFSLLIQGVNVFTGILLARGLGAQSRGELAAALLWPSILASLGNLGMSDATTYHAAQRRPGAGIVVGSVAAIWLVQSLVLCATALLIVPVVLGRYGSETVTASLIFVASIPFSLATWYSMSVLQGLNRMSIYQTIRLLVVLLAAVGLGAVALTAGISVRLSVVVYLGAYATCALVGFISVLRIVERPFRFSRETARSLFSYGIRSHTDSLATIFNQRLDQLLISIFLAPAQLGFYVIAVTLSSLTGVIGYSVSVVAMPAVARLSRGVERSRVAARHVQVALVSATVVTVPVLVLAPLLITTLFGPAFVPAGNVARLLLVGAVVFSVGRVLATTLKAVGRPLDAGIAEVIGLGVTVMGLAALLPLLGITGAAVASVVAYSVSALWMLRKATHALDLGWIDILVPRARAVAPNDERRINA